MSNSDMGPVKNLLKSLDKTDRYVVMLHYADGLTLREVSLVLDLPIRVVESILSRMRGKLLAAIAEAERQASEPPFTRRAAVA